MTAIVIFLVGFGLLFWFLNKRLKAPQEESPVTRMLQNQMNEIVRTLDNRLGESARIMSQQSGQNTKIVEQVVNHIKIFNENYLNKLSFLQKTLLSFLLVDFFISKDIVIVNNKISITRKSHSGKRSRITLICTFNPRA